MTRTEENGIFSFLSPFVGCEDSESFSFEDDWVAYEREDASRDRPPRDAGMPGVGVGDDAGKLDGNGDIRKVGGSDRGLQESETRRATCMV